MESKFLVQNPDVKLEDVRKDLYGNRCTGRGADTAAGRGYNVERLAKAVFESYGFFVLSSHEDSWFDTFVSESPGCLRIECKSCVYRYPSGAFGRFRIWRKNHRLLLGMNKAWAEDDKDYLYFFVVYTIEDGVEKEVGKLVTTVEQVDDIVDDWSLRDHPSMGQEFARDISWNMLLSELDISRETFKEQNLVNTTCEKSENSL